MNKEQTLDCLSRAERPLRLHLIGVAGSGMSGLAGLLLENGHVVSGSDRVATEETRRLQQHGLRFTSPHTATAVEGCDAVVYSSAIRPGNVAYDAALQAGIPMLRRAQTLAALMRGSKGLLVAGTHGKTTTSALLAHVLRVGGLCPSHYVGAEIPILGTNAHWDPAGEYFVAEGDESDGTLVEFAPEHAIILNIEEEHLDFYDGLEAIKAVFRQLIEQTRGIVVYCFEDAGARDLAGGRAGSVSYGWSEEADYHAFGVSFNRRWTEFTVRGPDGWQVEFQLGIPGRHNVLNALAVIAMARHLGVGEAAIAEALQGFEGARRRFEARYRSDRFSLIDDYGHHPSEIAATLATARSLEPERVLCLFQPHRFSRTQKFCEAFGEAFAEVDFVVVTEIYPASEPPIAGVTGERVVESIRRHTGARAIYVPELAKARLLLGNSARPGDLLMTLGAGNIHECAAPLQRDLEMAEALADAIGEEGFPVRLYEPMRKHTTILIGGPAQFWVEPLSFDGIARLVAFCKQNNLPVRVVGRGSNLLVRDGGIPGVVIHPGKGEFAGISVNGERLRAGVGVRFKALTAAARQAGISGFEWMEGIPGNVGGGLRMNAGAMGVQTFDQVESVRVLTEDGRIEERPAEVMGARYRDVPVLETEYALEATFRGVPDASVAEIDAVIAASRDKRRASQPVAASAGCIFKNPDSTPAGQLLDELALKEACVGAAKVSGVHGNFIVNEGGATASEVLRLIEQIRARVWQEKQVRLETEVQIVGEENLLF